MRHYGYMDVNYHLPKRSLAWFHRVRCMRLLRQTHPAKLAILYAEVHAGLHR